MRPAACTMSWRTMAAISPNHLPLFLHQLSPQERGQLINFLADVESAHYPEYQAIIQNLKGLQESDLAKEFQQAQAERSKQTRR